MYVGRFPHILRRKNYTESSITGFIINDPIDYKEVSVRVKAEHVKEDMYYKK